MEFISSSKRTTSIFFFSSLSAHKSLPSSILWKKKLLKSHYFIEKTEGKIMAEKTSNFTGSFEQSTEIRKEHKFNIENFENYLIQKQLKHFVPPLGIIRQYKSGQSNPTFYFQVTLFLKKK